jgi:hypothetical protein
LEFGILNLEMGIWKLEHSDLNNTLRKFQIPNPNFQIPISKSQFPTPAIRGLTFPATQLLCQSTKLLNSPHSQESSSGVMATKNEQTPIDNEISDETGQFDLRFVLWRHFCKQNNISVDILPSQLTEEQKEQWEELKSSRLKGRNE